VRERIELLVGRNELGARLLRAAALLALARVRLQQPPVEPAVFGEQHDQHEARREQPVDRPA
jgi:hypothetical protein